jgi:redox-sensitive bicupin YhaK (pirin superfamily)
MSSFELIPAHRAVLGENLEIRRALPSRARRMIGAWCFLDHAGPLALKRGNELRVGPHPHIGLQTFTWMIEGEILHRDSLGNAQRIRPGQVNLMTAGRGISHSEESVPVSAARMQTAQLWIALPDAQRGMEPAFENYPELPLANLGGFKITVLAGEACGERSPVRVHSPMLGLDLAAAGAAQASLPLDPAFEHGVLVLEGEAQVAGQSLSAGTLLYLPPGTSSLVLRCSAAARLLLIGGVPFGEPVLLWWNFVARSQEELARATADWNAGRAFGEVRGYDGPRLAAPDIAGFHLRR